MMLAGAYVKKNLHRPTPPRLFLYLQKLNAKPLVNRSWMRHKIGKSIEVSAVH